jgi:hypothetical protein
MSTQPVQPTVVGNLQATVQMNCHISDARFASDYTLCVYLLKMREFYRWEQQITYGESIESETIGNWLTDREQLWENLEELPFTELECGGQQFDPFDSDSINLVASAHGLIYSGGYGNQSKPVFFLAEAEQTIKQNGYTINIAGRELARDLTAPPAMSLGNTIYIRRESLRRMLWERLEEWRWNKPDNAMGRAIRFYDFDNDLFGALNKMTDNEVDALILHEIGEIRAGEQLGNDWQTMLLSFPRSKLQLTARAVRDHLADALSTLPTLLERLHPPSLHFYFANLNGMRKVIYPALYDAYDQWNTSGKPDALVDQIDSGKQHWLKIAKQMLALNQAEKETAPQNIEALIAQNYL